MIRGFSVLTKNLNNPTLKQKASMLDDALLRYRPAKREWQHIEVADDYLPQLKKALEVLNTALHLISNKISIDSFANWPCA